MHIYALYDAYYAEVLSEVQTWYTGLKDTPSLKVYLYKPKNATFFEQLWAKRRTIDQP